MKAFLRGVGRILAWLLLVAVLTGVLVGGVLAFFYSRTGEDKLPQDPVTYGGQALENVGYDWTGRGAASAVPAFARAGIGGPGHL